jgi:hypothetical protein
LDASLSPSHKQKTPREYLQSLHEIYRGIKRAHIETSTESLIVSHPDKKNKPWRDNQTRTTINSVVEAERQICRIVVVVGY